ncbi:MAG: sulfotransferase family 2 domain-containing protein [Owenweeksia sp.]|nr:sulfotransferase family 2 domain-containing protein [Owenweeksia sp.]
MKYLFLHVPKTAGTSLRKALEAKFSKEEVTTCYGKEQIQEKLSNALKQRKHLIYGHINFKCLNNVGGYNEYFLLAFLRHPVQWTISTYIHLLNSNNINQRKEAEAMGGFEGFLTSKFGNNWQCRFMSGIDQQTKAIIPSDELFAAAINNFEKLDWVGVAERYKESLISLKHFMGLRKIPYVRTNLSRDTTLKKRLEQEFSQEILHRNQRDLELWKFANQRLDEQLKSVPFAPLKKVQYSLFRIFG